jgi:HSP20 family protein
MALVRWNPMDEFTAFRKEMNRLFNDFLRRGDGHEGAWFAGTWLPPVDICETDEALILTAELPGLRQEDIGVELKDQMLTIRGERKPDSTAREEHYHRRERAYGAFQRSFLLPVDTAKVTASYRNGVLELRLPKAEAARPKRIAISS